MWKTSAKNERFFEITIEQSLYSFEKFQLLLFIFEKGKYVGGVHIWKLSPELRNKLNFGSTFEKTIVIGCTLWLEKLKFSETSHISQNFSIDGPEAIYWLSGKIKKIHKDTYLDGFRL